MKNRIISFIVAFICLFSLCPSVHAAQENSVYIIINYPNSILRSEYNVDVFLDNNLLTTIKNGEIYSVLIESLETGTHDIILTKSLDPSITVSKPFYIEQDTTLSFEIEAKKKSLEFSSVKQVTGIESSQIKIPELKYDYLDDAISSLEKLGLKDIHYVSDNGESIKKNSDWIVISQEPGKNEIVKSTDSITLTCTNADTFLSETFIDQSVISAETKAKQLHFNVTSYKNYITGKPMERPDSKLLSINDWVVSSAKSGSKLDRNVVLTLQYTGKVIMPNLLNMRLSDALEMLQDFQFSNIKYSTLDGSAISKPRNWKVVEQSLDFGDRLDASDPVILKCIEIEKGDEQVKSNSPESQYSFTKCFSLHAKRLIPHSRAKSDKDYYYLLDYDNSIFVELIYDEIPDRSFTYSVHHFSINSNNEIRFNKKESSENAKYYEIVKEGSNEVLYYYFEFVPPDIKLHSTYYQTDLKMPLIYLSRTNFFKRYPFPQLID